MADTTFVDKQTVFNTAWAQDVNDAAYKRKNVPGVGRIEAYSRGILADGTDQTTALVALLTSLSGWRGVLYIAFGTAFDMDAVYAAVPTGVMVLDESSVNIGHSPGGIQKMRILYGGDIASDDTSDVVASGHHPNRMFLNFGTAGTTSATGRYMSEIFGIGINYDGDPLTTILRQHKKDDGGNRWIISHRLQTPYAVAIKDPQPWQASHTYATGDYCISDSGKVYLATTGGTSGSSAITGTGTSITDGSCVWSYKFAAINIDSTFRQEREDGSVEIYGIPSIASSVFSSWTFGARVASLTVDLASGVQLQGMRSLPWTSISGATPTLTSTYCYVDNSSATNMTNLVLPTSQVQGFVVCFFANGNTTVQAGSGITLKGGASSVTPAAGTFMTFVKFTSYSSSWVEMSRSF